MTETPLHSGGPDGGACHAVGPATHVVSEVLRNGHGGRSSAGRKLAITNLVAVLVPPLGLLAAILLLWGTAFNGWHLAIMGGMMLLSAFGITIGYHRLCTHKSFTTSALLRYLFAAAGSMAVQGPVIRWCADHRRHHQHSDTEGDPHSPHVSASGSWGGGILATLRGAFHAHMGWMLTAHGDESEKYSADLRRDRALVLANNQFVPWVIVGLVLPAVAGGLVSMSWTGVLLGFLWGGLVRVLLLHHITWSVNSVCHLWGTRPFECHDESRTNPLVALLAMGEGWHNNHHAFPTSARHGLRWWELDLSYLVIRVLAALGLAKNVRVPSLARIRTRERRREGAGDRLRRGDGFTGRAPAEG